MAPRYEVKAALLHLSDYTTAYFFFILIEYLYPITYTIKSRQLNNIYAIN